MAWLMLIGALALLNEFEQGWWRNNELAESSFWGLRSQTLLNLASWLYPVARSYIMVCVVFTLTGALMTVIIISGPCNHCRS